MIERITTYTKDRLRLEERLQKTKLALGIFAAGALAGSIGSGIYILERNNDDENRSPEIASQTEICTSVSVDDNAGSGAQERVIDPAIVAIYNELPEDSYSLRLNAAKQIDIHPGDKFEVCAIENGDNNLSSIRSTLIE